MATRSWLVQEQVTGLAPNDTRHLLLLHDGMLCRLKLGLERRVMMTREALDLHGIVTIRTQSSPREWKKSVQSKDSSIASYPPVRGMIGRAVQKKPKGPMGRAYIEITCWRRCRAEYLTRTRIETRPRVFSPDGSNTTCLCHA
jgi:hypothetical protein